MYKELFKLLLATLSVLLGITIILFVFFQNNIFIKINLFMLSIVLFVSFLSKKKILTNSVLTLENKMLMAVMIIVIVQYFFGLFFIFGKLFAENFIK